MHRETRTEEEKEGSIPEARNPLGNRRNECIRPNSCYTHRPVATILWFVSTMSISREIRKVNRSIYNWLADKVLLKGLGFSKTTNMMEG
jgi:hypothetical protein